MSRPHKIHLITGGKYHDFNLARRSLLAQHVPVDLLIAGLEEDRFAPIAPRRNVVRTSRGEE